MKKNYWSLILLGFFILAAGFVVIRYKTKQGSSSNTAYPLLARKDSNHHAEWNAARENTDKLIAKIKANPADTRSALALANAYIMEARISGNIAYYDKAAMSTVDDILAREPANYEALMLRSLIQLSQHHFEEGLATAQAAQKIDANSAFVYGLLVDANIEMGNYQAALEAADKMVSIRPDMRSYSRIAYLREIHGDYPGAVEAMRLAVEAGAPGEESTEWCRAQLGKLYESMGMIDKAVFQYKLSLAARPGYSNALAGMGRVSSFEKKYDSAVYYFQQAANTTNDLGIKTSLAMAYRNAGMTGKANELNRSVITEMTKNAGPGKHEPGVGHYSDKELAYEYIENKNYDKALEHALAEYNRRPKNIDVNQTMAWVYYKRNEFSKALPYLEAALTTHSMDPVLLCTAGLIYAKTGDMGKARLMLGLGLKNDPIMPAVIKNESEETFKAMSPQ